MPSPYSDILTAIDARLTYHVGSSQVLDGMTYKNGPVEETIEDRNLPIVQLFIPEIRESWIPRKPTTASIDVNILVKTRRSDGIPNLVSWVEKVLDALEIDHDGTGDRDYSLGGTIRVPFDARTGGSFAEEISLNAQVTLSCKPAALVIRGDRRS